ncbi:MAG: metal-dependent transcriptional regulator [Oscillospiraceae bacterium]|nr:metal-dependent transcriptional regulator [Oscillospiraceae bacterium]
MAAAKTVGAKERDTALSPAAVRYLLTIFDLSGGLGAVRSVDIAETLCVTRASVVYMLGVLAEGEFIRKRPYGSVQLTPAGVHAAKELNVKYNALDTLFTQRLNLKPDAAHKDAVACLCNLSAEAVDQLTRLALQGEQARCVS